MRDEVRGEGLCPDHTMPLNLPDHLGLLPHFPSLRTVCSCLSRDAKCGKIQCQGGASRPVIGTNAVSIETNIPLQEGGRILCRGTHVYLGDDLPDPGLVLAGTKCADGKVSPSAPLRHKHESGKTHWETSCLRPELQGWFVFQKPLLRMLPPKSSSLHLQGKE